MNTNTVTPAQVGILAVCAEVGKNYPQVAELVEDARDAYRYGILSSRRAAYIIDRIRDLAPLGTCGGCEACDGENACNVA